MTWDEAREAVLLGKKVFMHHKGKTVRVTKDTTFEELQWEHFGSFRLTWTEILNGKYTIE